MYDVIVCDPPWKYYGDPNKDQAAGKHYSCMSLEEMSRVDIPINNPGVLFMWTTGPQLDTSIRLLDAWKLYYRGVAFVWVKTTLAGKIISGQGVRPSVVKPTTELVLCASNKQKGRPLPLLDESIGQVVLAPRGKHSQKPESIQDRIELMYGPDLSYAELFARRERSGWDCLGDELGTIL